MRDDELDRILSGDTGIVPSSGFTRSVMETVRRDAAAPPPIPFPWKAALPGLVACAVILILADVSGFRSASLALPDWGRFVPAVDAALAAAVKMGAGWVALALLLTLGSVTLSMRLTGRRG